MKKLMTTTTLAFMATIINLHANGYEGPQEDLFWAWMGDAYNGVIFDTTLGCLALDSDIIGVGQVSHRTNNHFTVTIDHAVLGCTNGAAIVVYCSVEEQEVIDDYLLPYFPTNLSRIVFAARTNEYEWSRMFWDQTQIPEKPWHIRKKLTLEYLNRSWWYADRDDGELFKQFTNALQVVRFDRSWTNFVYLCRDNANSPSNRVREDLFWDLRIICIQANNEQRQFLLDDPLIDPKHKERMLQ